MHPLANLVPNEELIRNYLFHPLSKMGHYLLIPSNQSLQMLAIVHKHYVLEVAKLLARSNLPLEV
jgi:hypothetical protein